MGDTAGDAGGEATVSWRKDVRADNRSSTRSTGHHHLPRLASAPPGQAHTRPRGAAVTASQRPDFALAMRGYDRAQVDEFVAHQTARLGFAETRAQQAAASAAAARHEVEQLRARLAGAGPAEQESAPRSLQAVGERVNAILEKATEAAEEVRAEAQKEADRMRTEAAESGRADAERGLAELRASHADLERRTAELSQRRDDTVAQLDRLRQALEHALGSLTAEPAAQTPPAAASPSDDTVVDLTAPGATGTVPEEKSGPTRMRRVQ